jgi:hypothetical protein
MRLLSGQLQRCDRIGGGRSAIGQANHEAVQAMVDVSEDARLAIEQCGGCFTQLAG